MDFQRGGGFCQVWCWCLGAQVGVQGAFPVAQAGEEFAVVQDVFGCDAVGVAELFGVADEARAEVHDVHEAVAGFEDGGEAGGDGFGGCQAVVVVWADPEEHG